MKTSLEQEDIQAIASAVMEMLKPMLSSNGKHEAEDDLLTAEELAMLLKLKGKKKTAQIYAWVNESKYTNGGIPFLKAGKFLRFSKKDVFQWMSRHNKSVEDW